MSPFFSSLRYNVKHSGTFLNFAPSSSLSSWNLIWLESGGAMGNGECAGRWTDETVKRGTWLDKIGINNVILYLVLMNSTWARSSKNLLDVLVILVIELLFWNSCCVKFLPGRCASRKKKKSASRNEKAAKIYLNILTSHCASWERSHPARIGCRAYW